MSIGMWMSILKITEVINQVPIARVGFEPEINPTNTSSTFLAQLPSQVSIGAHEHATKFCKMTISRM